MPSSDWAGDSIESCSCGHFHGADMELTPKRYMDTVVLSPMGRIDHSTSEDFKAALAPHMTRCAEGQDRVVLDFAGVEYISSVGLRVLMLASKQAKAQRGSLGVAALQPAVREIFDISRFTMVLDVFPSVHREAADVEDLPDRGLERGDAERAPLGLGLLGGEHEHAQPHAADVLHAGE